MSYYDGVTTDAGKAGVLGRQTAKKQDNKERSVPNIAVVWLTPRLTCLIFQCRSSVVCFDTS